MVPPMAKKVRSEADDLIPEQRFIAEHPGPVTFRVQVPNLPDRPEWKMNGQLITMTLPITDPVSVIKAKVSTEFGMPSGKQKLQIGSIFVKDSNSLAFYNICGSSVVQLGLKERGGRKR
jgi:splicing factor 3A subunit 1